MIERKRFCVTLLLTAFVLSSLTATFGYVHAASPIVFDAESSATPCTSSCPSTLSWTHAVGITVSGVQSILIVSVFAATSPTNTLKPVTGIVYGNSALTFIGSHVVAAGGNQGAGDLEMWGLLNPLPGVATVNVTLGGSDDALFAGSVSYFNVAGIGAFAGTDNNSAKLALPSLTINASSGDLVVDTVMGAVLADNTGAILSPGSLQTERWSRTGVIVGPDQEIFVGGSDKAASSPVTMTWTSADTLLAWLQDAVVLTPPAPIPEYPLGLPILAIFMIIAYGVVRRRTHTK